MGSRFYGEVDGRARTAASRVGTKTSGLSGHLRGWDVGVRAYLHVNDEGEDVVDVYLTGGTHGYLPSKFLGQFRAEDLR